MTGKPHIKDIFFQVVEMETAESRDRYLVEACGGDDDLRKRVEALLAADADPQSCLEHPAAEFRLEATDDLSSGPQRPGSDVTERSGSLIGPYKLLEQIGEGGMGVVYMAEQKKPVRRKVALKIIKPGMDTQAGRRPIRGRAAGAGDDGPSEHRQGVGCRQHGIGPTLLCDGTGAGRPDHRILRSEQTRHAGTAGAVHRGLPSGAARPHKGIIHRDIKPIQCAGDAP